MSIRAYSSIAVIPSKTTPGVLIHVRKVSDGRRDALRKVVAPILDRMAVTNADLEKVREEVGFTDDMEKDAANAHFESLPSTEKKKLDDAAVARQLVSLEFDRAYLEFGFVKTENFKLDEIENPTAHDILALADPALTAEISKAARDQFEMSDEQRAGFESLSTSGAAEDGKAKLTTAQTAESPDTTQKETADSTSLGI